MDAHVRVDRSPVQLRSSHGHEHGRPSHPARMMCVASFPPVFGIEASIEGHESTPHSILYQLPCSTHAVVLGASACRCHVDDLLAARAVLKLVRSNLWRSPCRKSDTQRLNVTQPSPRSLHPVHVDGRLTPYAMSDIVAATIGVHTVNVYFCRSSPVRRSSKLQHRHSSRIQRAGVRCPSHQVQRPPDSRKILNPLIIYAGRSDRIVR